MSEYPDTQHPDAARRPNPYQYASKWFWYDETGCPCGPYDTQAQALKALADYAHFLDYGPTVWQTLRYEFLPWLWGKLRALLAA